MTVVVVVDAVVGTRGGWAIHAARIEREGIDAGFVEGGEAGLEFAVEVVDARVCVGTEEKKMYCFVGQGFVAVAAAVVIVRVEQVERIVRVAAAAVGRRERPDRQRMGQECHAVAGGWRAVPAVAGVEQVVAEV